LTTTAQESGKARVTRLKIEKFRAIGSAEIELGDTVALVGQSGAGKSSVLRALNAFFNFEAERDAFEAGLHRYSSTTQSIIEVEITGLPAGGLPLDGATGMFLGRLKFQRKPIWQVWKAGKWETVPEFHDALRQHITYALVPIRRDHWVAHDPAGGLLEKAVEPNGVDIQRHVCVLSVGLRPVPSTGKPRRHLRSKTSSRPGCRV